VFASFERISVHLPATPHVEFTTHGDDTAGTAPAGDFRRLFSVGSNMLVRGEKSATTATVVALGEDLSAPLVTWNAGADSDFPGLDQGTVVLQDVDRLDLAAQRQLLAWLDDRGGRVRVISTARHNLFDLVMSGEFLDPLYYRLNTVVVDVVATDARRTAQ
jgi:Sigma-54 interaction domain